MIRACIEQQSLRYYIEEAKRQNKEYFEMKARDLISKEKDDMVAAVQANLLFQSLNMTREEILEKYPINNHLKTETMDEEGDQCTVDNVDAMASSALMTKPEPQQQIQMQPYSGSSHQPGELGDKQPVSQAALQQQNNHLVNGASSQPQQTGVEQPPPDQSSKKGTNTGVSKKENTPIGVADSHQTPCSTVVAVAANCQESAKQLNMGKESAQA